jgi:AraC family transcriptional regulator, regulatory protein of adaptative response / methylated-DNA-[protein]-cysteine methyltransferase
MSTVPAARTAEASAAHVDGRPKQPVYVAEADTPLGEMVAASTASHLLLLEFANRRMLETQLRRVLGAMECEFADGETPVFASLRTQLDEYFRGERCVFDVPLHVPGSPFQLLVWEALQRIPFGSTTSYGRLATSIGQPAAVRAVARANGDNRIAILIPCHRVIGADGSLTGYGGGLWRKKKLLDLEARTEELSLPGF